MKNNLIKKIRQIFMKIACFVFEPIKVNIKYYLMAITALIMISCVIYVKFLRIRLPREIPFRLSLYGFIILVLICGSYLYAIKTLVKEPKPNTLLLYILQKCDKPIQYILISLETLDSGVKNNKLIKPYYSRLKEYLIPLITEFGSTERVLLVYLFVLIPGYILLFILMVDVFYLHHIKIYYYFIIVHILPLLYAYYRYSLSIIKEEYFAQLESEYRYVTIFDENYSYTTQFEKFNPKAIYHDKEVSIREYFTIQLNHLYIEYPDYDPEDPESYEIQYVGYPTNKLDSLEQYEVDKQKAINESTHEELKILEKEFRLIEPKLLKLMDYIMLNQHTQEFGYIKPLRILLYSLYFITWFYILVKSIHTLPENLAWIKEAIIVAGNLIQLLTRRCISVSFIKVSVVLTIMMIYYFYRKQ